MFLSNYYCRMMAVQIPLDEEGDDPRWKYLLEYNGVGEDDGKKVSMPSIHSYASPFDAIQDAYGILELLGFRFNPEFTRSKVVITNLDKDGNSDPVVYWFDGYDFFKTSGEEGVV